MNAATNGLTRYVKEILQRPQGKVDAARKFLVALTGIVDICLNEMQQELEDFRAKVSIDPQWGAELSGILNRSIISVFGKKVNEDAAQALSDRAAEWSTSHREILRREWAITFYNSFMQAVNAEKSKLDTLDTNLKAIQAHYTQSLISEQNSVESNSKFRIYLHAGATKNVSDYRIDDTLRTRFTQYVNTRGGIYSWLGQSEENLRRILWDFASTTSEAQNAAGTTIDDVLRNMSQEDVLRYIDYLKRMSSPMWTYSTRGFTAQRQEMDNFLIVGVPDCGQSALQASDVFKGALTVGVNKPTYVSTHQKDRIFLLNVEDLLPVYAVNNFETYSQENEMKSTGNRSNYLDRKMFDRMNSEGFSMLPKVQQDDTLETWVLGLVFGYIQFDPVANTYWVRSERLGEPIDDFRYNLAKDRPVAFDLFKSQGIDAEIKEILTAKRIREGHAAYQAKIDQIKADRTYFLKHSQLSEWERENIRQPQFATLKALIDKEIRLMS